MDLRDLTNDDQTDRTPLTTLCDATAHLDATGPRPNDPGQIFVTQKHDSRLDRHDRDGVSLGVWHQRPWLVPSREHVG